MKERFFYFKTKKTDSFLLLLTSMSGLFYRRGVLSWLCLLGYSHLCFWACLAVWPGYGSGLFLVSFAFIGIMTPICFLLCLFFFLLGLMGKGAWLFSKCFFFPGGAALGLSKLILFLFFIIITYILLQFFITLLFLFIKNSIKSFIFLFFFIFFIIYYIIKYDFLFFIFYKLFIEFFTWLYTYSIFFFIKYFKKFNINYIKLISFQTDVIKFIYYVLYLWFLKKRKVKNYSLQFSYLYHSLLILMKNNVRLKNNLKSSNALQKMILYNTNHFYNNAAVLEDKRKMRENIVLLQTLYENSSHTDFEAAFNLKNKKDL